MTDVRATIGKFPPKDPRVILRALAEHAGRGADDGKRTQPLVGVFTTDGHCFTGWVVGVDSDKAEECVLLHCPENLKSPQQADIVYLSTRQVSAVKVYNAEEVAPVLSFGEVARAPGEEAPSRLQLKRELQEITQKLRKDADLNLTVEMDWTSAPEGDDSHLNIQEVGRAIAKAVPATAEDDLGRSAWKPFATILIRHQSKASLSAQKSGKSVVITADLSRGLPDPLQKAMQRALNEIL